ncbi:MAG: SGNH/GDSL hydrolase family protein [Planctomycetota bacterium]
MKSKPRFGLRVLVAVVSLVIALLFAELVARWVQGQADESNLHVRFALTYQDADRKPMSVADAGQRGYTQLVDPEEMVPIRPFATGASADLTADGWIRFRDSRLLGKPAIASQNNGLGERVVLRGTGKNDGFYWPVELDGDQGIRLDRRLIPEQVEKTLELAGLRERPCFAPNRTWYICYTGFEGTDRAAYFDSMGCVENRMNSAAIRDREEVAQPKPPGQRRILCLGDSFTFGWGVKFEDCWTQLVERELRKGDDQVRTVNCGASGSMYVDEYVRALEHRLHRLSPDAVVITLCLNDLIPSSHSLAHQEGSPWLLRKSRLLRSLFQRYALESALRIDPSRDLVGELLALDEIFYPLFARPEPPYSVGRATLWPGGGPQRALLRARDWCAERKLGFGVVIWPYFQGLGESEHYPFERLHRMVGDYCGEHGIPFLDLLPTFRGKVALTSELWVSPADYHGNERAQAIAAPPLTDFLKLVLGPR